MSSYLWPHKEGTYRVLLLVEHKLIVIENLSLSVVRLMIGGRYIQISVQYPDDIHGCVSVVGMRMSKENRSTVDSRLSAVMVGRIGVDNQNQRINRSTHAQARYTGIKLTSLIFYAIN
jgi:hypothetical protein